MKFLKLSLATAMAAGALSSISAASLEEAIKDVDVSGWGRYRYESEHKKASNKHTSYAFNRFTLDVNFKATLDDNFFSVIGVRYDARDNSGTTANSQANTHGGGTGINGGWGGEGYDAFGIRYYNIGYTGIENTTIILGRQTMGTFFADDIVGTGAKLIFTPTDGITIVAAAFDNIEQDDYVAGGDNAPYLHNFYSVGAIGSFEPVTAQAWYGLSQEVAQFWAAALSTNFDLTDDLSLNARANVAGTSFRNKYKVTNNAGNSTFVGAEIGANFAGLDAKIGYVTYGKKDKWSAHSLEFSGGLIYAGEMLLGYYYANEGKHDAMFAKAKYQYGDYSIGYDFVYDKVKDKPNAKGTTKNQEHTIRAGYRFNEKMSINAWHAFVTYKNPNGDKDKENFFRFDAVYSF